jgi:hypothetical protein
MRARLLMKAPGPQHAVLPDGFPAQSSVGGRHMYRCNLPLQRVEVRALLAHWRRSAWSLRYQAVVAADVAGGVRIGRLLADAFLGQ